jgi:glycosyltransferase involved in cell wall biosynthesis
MSGIVTNTALSSGFDLIVLTWNEEKNLAYCLQSVQDLARNIFVVDSGSTDRTIEIAREYGAQVVTHAFINQAEQLNWALDNLPVQSEWVLRLDADEYLSDELREEIVRTLSKVSSDVSGFYIKYRLVFLERWIRYGGYYPVWILRLFRYGKARCDRAEMDEKMVLLEGRSAKLKNDFIHHDRKGLSAWTRKHEGYAARQARVLLQSNQAGGQANDIQPRLLGGQAERKRWLKHYVYARVPLFWRAFLFFAYRYFFRLGFLDGTPGLVFHFLHACWYMFYIDSRIYEYTWREADQRLYLRGEAKN